MSQPTCPRCYRASYAEVCSAAINMGHPGYLDDLKRAGWQDMTDQAGIWHPCKACGGGDAFDPDDTRGAYAKAVDAKLEAIDRTLEAMYAHELAGSEEGARELLRVTEPKAPDYRFPVRVGVESGQSQTTLCILCGKQTKWSDMVALTCRTCLQPPVAGQPPPPCVLCGAKPGTVCDQTAHDNLDRGMAAMSGFAPPVPQQTYACAKCGELHCTRNHPEFT